MKYLIIILFTSLYLSVSVNAQAYYTRALSPDIYTIQVEADGEWGQLPVITNKDGSFVNISFDRISDDSFRQLRYKIIACNADWTINRNLSEIEYLDGFNDGSIDNYNSSFNTTVHYTHFNLNIPNRDTRIRLPGNYVVQVYDPYNNEILLTACFSIVDPQINIQSAVSSVTLIDANKAHQQVSINLQHQMPVRNPHTDLKIYVRQNDRLDSERSDLKPTMITPNRISYERNRDLIFEAGNEYRRFETSTRRSNGFNVAHIRYVPPHYAMDISADKVRAGRGYSYDQDQNGRLIIRNREGNNNNLEADYFLTSFHLEMDEPLSQRIYINGAFTNNQFNDKYEMKYDSALRAYTITLLLKQGLYNYQYLAQSGDKYITAPIEGNYYQTENEYAILVYYRPAGQRYDSLIGYQTIRSREK